MFDLASFYYYIKISDVKQFIEEMKTLCTKKLLGRILCASEGINGSISGDYESVTSFINYFNQHEDFKCMEFKITRNLESPPFPHLTIREVGQIISVGIPKVNELLNDIEFDKNTIGGMKSGIHLSPSDFHEALMKYKNGEGESKVIDIRNGFEFDIGHFENAENINTKTYSETWKALDNILSSDEKEKNLYLYCTGGIRCEKASAYLVRKGYKNVFQLHGGIHRYFEEFPDGGFFRGKNFVFDKRVSQVSNKDDICGCCIECKVPYDVYDGKICCTVCRQIVLICPSCKVIENRERGEEYYCILHRNWKGIYFTNLTKFTVEELKEQLGSLETVFKSLCGLKVNKNRRRTIRRQREKIFNRIKLMESVDSLTLAKIDENERNNVKVEGKWGFWLEDDSVYNNM